VESEVGGMVFVTFLIALGRVHASTSYAVGGFLRHAVDTFAMNMLGVKTHG
jgi:hypothetical protein